MRYSGVGGQAVMEGVMMRNGDEYAVAVRKPDKTIEVKKFEYNSAKKTKGIRKVPFLRGIFNFIDSLYLGMSTLMYSASFFQDEEEEQGISQMTEEEKAQIEDVVVRKTGYTIDMLTISMAKQNSTMIYSHNNLVALS